MLRSLVVICVFSFISACSGGGSGGGGGYIPTKNISGKVSDPAVIDVRVTLVDSNENIVSKCGINGSAVCQGWTDSNGKFSITMPLSYDVSNYSIKTYGGTDSLYGKNFDNISFATLPLSNYQNHLDILVTPITSLQKGLVDIGLDVESANTIIEKYLKITKDKVLKDPESDDLLLKVAYNITKIAMAKGGNNPFKEIASSLNKNKLSLNDSKVLSSIFGENSPIISEILSSYNNIMSLGSSGEVLKNDIKKSEFINIFTYSYLNLLQQDLSTIEANVKNNLKNFAEKIYKDTPLDDFIVNVITSYVSALDTSLGNIETFKKDVNTFSSELATILSKNKSIYSEIQKIVEEKVYIVNAGLNPLGNDNQKRLEYYFNSNLDVNYMARSIISRVNNDQVRDKIYLEIIDTYAEYNLITKAKSIADVHIKNTINRAKAYRLIAKGAYRNKNNAKAIELLDLSYNILQSIRASYSVDADFINVYTGLATYYAKVNKKDKYQSLIKDIIDNLIPSAPKPQTVYGSILSSYGNYATESAIKVDIDNREYKSAFESLSGFISMVDDYYNKYYDSGYDTKKTQNTVANTSVMYYSSALRSYADISSGDTTLKSQCITEGQKVYDKLVAIYDKIKSESLHENTTFQGQFSNGAVGAISLLGLEKGNKLLDYMTQASRKEAVASEVMYSVALTQGFEKAKETYESIAPVDGTFSNVVGSKKLVSSFVSFGVQEKGLAIQAFYDNKYDLARQALDYAYEKVKAAAEYQLKQPSPNPASFFSLNPTVTNSSTQLKTYSGFTSKYNRDGYTAIAYLYFKIGDKDKAREVLENGYNFNSQIKNNTFIKYYNIASLAYNAKVTENNDLYEKWYQETKSFQLDSNEENGHKYSLELFRAMDSIYMGQGNYQSISKGHLESALNILKGLYLPSDVDGILNSAVSKYLEIATVYNTLNDNVNAKKILIEAETPLNNIKAANTKKTGVLNIVGKYGSFQLVEDGFNKTQTLLTLPADRHDAIGKMAESLTAYSTSDLSISDLDKDGKVDFFVPYATSDDINRLALELDDDIDGDSKLDDVDTTPFFAD